MGSPKTFKSWYADNKDRIAQERKQRYDNDPEYRETVKARAADYRDRTRAATPKPESTGLMTIQEVCESLEVKEWTLNRWRSENYYPAPKKVLGRPMFTGEQLSLLGLIREFFVKYPKRRAGLFREELGTIVDVVHHNWNA